MARKPPQRRPGDTAPTDTTAPASAQRAGPRQAKLASLAARLDAAPPVQRLAKGLPAPLQAGIESLSGISMDHVQVHYGSSSPAQLQAHAYAQGPHIHLAPGQEHHLPHEAWHVVQQAQGRVRANLDVSGTPVNDSAALEREADVMGRRALASPPAQRQALRPGGNEGGQVAQLAGDYAGLLPAHDTHRDNYTFQQQQLSEFTYHHIIPENKLHTAHEKLRAILKHAGPHSTVHAGVQGLKANARKQWIKTRAVNTAHAVNSEFQDFGLHLGVDELVPLMEAHHTLNDLFNAVLALATKKLTAMLEKQFNEQAGKLKPLLVSLFDQAPFLAAWSQGQGGDLLTAEIDQVNKQIHGHPMYDTAEFLAILREINPRTLKGRMNKGELLQALLAHAHGPAMRSFFQRCYTDLHNALSTSKTSLVGLVRLKGLPKEDQDELEDAITWNPGNIHRGPKSSLRLSPDNAAQFDRLLDDGGDSFEVAAVNVVSSGHYASLELLSRNIEHLNAANVDQPDASTIQLASGIVHQMIAIQSFGVTHFQALNWQEHPAQGPGTKPFMRLVQNNQAIHDAQMSSVIAPLGRAKGIAGI